MQTICCFCHMKRAIVRIAQKVFLHLSCIGSWVLSLRTEQSLRRFRIVCDASIVHNGSAGSDVFSSKETLWTNGVWLRRGVDWIVSFLLLLCATKISFIQSSWCILLACSKNTMRHFEWRYLDSCQYSPHCVFLSFSTVSIYKHKHTQ